MLDSSSCTFVFHTSIKLYSYNLNLKLNFFLLLFYYYLFYYCIIYPINSSFATQFKTLKEFSKK